MTKTNKTDTAPANDNASADPAEQRVVAFPRSTLAKAPAQDAKAPKPHKPRPAPKTQDQPAPAPAARAPTKIQILVDLMRRPQGALIGDLAAATGWQHHSVRGALAGHIKKKLGLEVISDKTEAGRVYRIADQEQAA